MIRALPARLAVVASFVPPGEPMADIGTDHARLPVWLVEAGRVPRAVAVDERAAPLRAARALVARRGVDVDLREGWGCRPLREGEVTTVTIAGLGGERTTRILEDLPASVGRLVLQPNTEERRVRAWLAEHGWRLDAEHLLLDPGRWFATFAAVRGEEPDRPDEVDLTWGRASLHRDRDALARCLDEDEHRLRRLRARNPAVDAELTHLSEARRRLGMSGVPPPATFAP